MRITDSELFMLGRVYANDDLHINTHKGIITSVIFDIPDDCVGNITSNIKDLKYSIKDLCKGYKYIEIQDRHFCSLLKDCFIPVGYSYVDIIKTVPNYIFNLTADMQMVFLRGVCSSNIKSEDYKTILGTIDMVRQFECLLNALRVQNIIFELDEAYTCNSELPLFYESFIERSIHFFSNTHGILIDNML